MQEPTRCPVCKADFTAGEIPEEDRESFGGNTHFSRVQSIYDKDLDRTVAWRCPDCKAEWPR